MVLRLGRHKRVVVACVLAGQERTLRSFGTLTEDLEALAGWLEACGVTHVVAELHASVRDLDEEIAELASLYTRLVSAELDRAAALMPPAPPGAERCGPASARAPRSP